jgi:hypothetical protein
MAVFKKGRYWYIDYYVQGQRKRKKIGPSKQVAELALKDVELKIAKGEYLGIYEERKFTFHQFAPEYLAYSKANKSHTSSCRDRVAVDHWLSPSFGERFLFQITIAEVERYKQERLEMVSPSTVNKELNCLKAMLNKMVPWSPAPSGAPVARPMSRICACTICDTPLPRTWPWAVTTCGRFSSS